MKVFDMVSSGDQVVVAAEQVVHSRLQDVGRLAGRLLPGWMVDAASNTLPVVTPGRVPTTVHLSIGKNDAGDPVVTRMSVVFNLPSALCPHVRLPIWQQRLAKQGGDATLSAVQAAGAVAAVAEDAWTAAAAAWRAGGAIGDSAWQEAAGPTIEALKNAASAAVSAAMARITQTSEQLELVPAGTTTADQ